MTIFKYAPLCMGLAVTAYYYFAAGAKGGRVGAALRWFTAIASTGMMIYLLTLFLGQKYGFNYVFQNSGRDLPLIYRISAVWAGQEGTFLMWYWLTALLLVAMVRLGDLEQITYASIGLILTIIGVFLVYSPPFAPLAPDILANIKEQIRQGMISADFLKGGAPADGNGLNPVLRNEWMAIHPPLIFIGYALIAAPFALAAAGIARGDLTSWTSRGRVWTAAAWAFLGAGIFCGSYWAYIILGWGGYWAWDPVENASLLPWIAAAALSHGLILQAGGKRFAQWNTALAFTGIFMVILTTFLTRSGAMAEFSVHSFGKSPLYLPILICLLAFLLFSVVMFIKAGIILNKQKTAAARALPWAPRVLSWTVLMLMVLLGFVMVGTLFPLISKIGFLDKLPVIGRIFAGEAAAVEQAYYNKTTILSMAIIGSFLAVCPFLFVKVAMGMKSRMRLVIAITGAILGALTLTIADPVTKSKAALFAYYLLSALAGAVISVNVVSALHFYKLKRWNFAGYAIHIGVGLMILGVIASTAGSRSAQLALPQGQPVKSGDAEFTFVRANIDPETREVTALIDLKRKDKLQTVSIKSSNQMSQTAPRPTIIGKFGSDLYIIPETLENPSGMDMGAGMPPRQVPEPEQQPIPVGSLKIDRNTAVKAGAYTLKLKGWNIAGKMMQQGKVGVIIAAERDGKTADIEIPYSAMERDYKKQEKTQLPDGTKLTVVRINVQREAPANEFALVVVDKDSGKSSKPGPGSMLPRGIEDDQPRIILASLTVAQMPPAGNSPEAGMPAGKSGGQEEMPPSEEQMPPLPDKQEQGMPPGHENMPPAGMGEQGEMQMPPGHENMSPEGMGGMPEGMPGMPGGMPQGHGSMMGGQGPAIIRIKIMTKPFISLLWIGMALVTAGAFAAAFSRNKSAHSEKQEDRQHDSAPDAEA